MRNKRILRGFMNKNNKDIRFLYRKVYPMIVDFVLKNNGRKEDAEDLFQEGLLIIFKKIQNKDFKINCKFTTYLYTICRNHWCKELRRKSHIDNECFDKFDLEDTVRYQNSIELKQFELYKKHLSKLDIQDQKILQLHFERKNIDEIMRITGLKNRQAVIDKKYRSKKKLMLSIINDPEYLILQNEILMVD